MSLNSIKRYAATGPVVIGIINQNLINNARQSATGEIHLPSLMTLAKMLYNGSDFIDSYSFDQPPPTSGS